MKKLLITGLITTALLASGSAMAANTPITRAQAQDFGNFVTNQCFQKATKASSYSINNVSITFTTVPMSVQKLPGNHNYQQMFSMLKEFGITAQSPNGSVNLGPGIGTLNVYVTFKAADDDHVQCVVHVKNLGNITATATANGNGPLHFHGSVQ